MGDTTDPDFVKLDGTAVTVNPQAKAGASAIIGTANENGSYRALTFVNGGDGTYSITYHTADTLSLTDSVYALQGSWGEAVTFRKTGDPDVLTLTCELPAGEHTFRVCDQGTGSLYGKDEATIAETANRLVLVSGGGAVTLQAAGGSYAFRFERSTNRLSVFAAQEIPEPTAPPNPTDEEPASGLTGDVNGDGTVDIMDVIALNKYLLGSAHLAEDAKQRADADANTVLDSTDSLLILKYVVSLLKELPVT